jgi:hypothetical protein
LVVAAASAKLLVWFPPSMTVGIASTSDYGMSKLEKLIDMEAHQIQDEEKEELMTSVPLVHVKMRITNHKLPSPFKRKG